jgi:uncharacterized protein (TIGR03435 family)
MSSDRYDISAAAAGSELLPHQLDPILQALSDGTDNLKPSVFTAVSQQSGLKLESAKGPTEVLVIDHAERPSEN